MKKFIQTITALIFLASIYFSSQAQEFDFQNTTYYYRLPNDSLISSGLTLASFDFSSANATDSIFHDGIYFPANDCFGNNLWIRLRHIAADPNGNSVGINVPSTTGSPCQSGIIIGGWAGFLYDLEIHRDINLTGTRGYYVGVLFPTSITVASLEWLGGPCNYNEWLCFMIMNSGSTGWSLNSINFTGINPQSNPVFSDTLAVYTSGGCYPPDGFSYTFPTGADSVSATSGSQGGSGLSEFKMSAGNVSHFQYGYEYAGLSSGYQGMSMAFGSVPTFTFSSSNVACKNGNDGEISVSISGGIGPFTYEWNDSTNTGNSLSALSAGTYHLTVTDQNGCGAPADTTIIITEPVIVSMNVDSTHLTNVQCHNGNDGSIQLYTSGINAPYNYIWNNGATDSLITDLTAGNYFVTISDQNSCLVIRDTITEPAAIDISTTSNGVTITANETGATFQWIDCNGNTLIADSTNVSITPNATGDYKVAINKNGCLDTSACIHIIVVGVEEVNITIPGFTFFPNPTSGKIFIGLNKSYEQAEISITDLDGRIIFSINEANKKYFELSHQIQPGIYFIILKTDEGRVVRKLIVE